MHCANTVAYSLPSTSVGCRCDSAKLTLHEEEEVAENPPAKWTALLLLQTWYAACLKI
jgi:hypothetical protein